MVMPLVPWSDCSGKQVGSNWHRMTSRRNGVGGKRRWVRVKGRSHPVLLREFVADRVVASR